jgi:hypothetical protein
MEARAEAIVEGISMLASGGESHLPMLPGAEDQQGE